MRYGDGRFAIEQSGVCGGQVRQSSTGIPYSHNPFFFFFFFFFLPAYFFLFLFFSSPENQGTTLVGQGVRRITVGTGGGGEVKRKGETARERLDETRDRKSREKMGKKMRVEKKRVRE